MRGRTFRVALDAHTLAGGRYEIPARTVTIPGPDETFARMTAIREAHTTAAVPPWRPLLRESWPHTRIVCHTPPRPVSEYL